MEAEFKRLAHRAVSSRRLPRARKADPQTLVYPFAPEWAWVASHYLRTPSRVFWRLAELSARRLEPLHDEIYDVLCERSIDWIDQAQTMSVEVRRSGDFPAGPLQIRGAVKSAIMAAAAHRGHKLKLEPEAPDRLFAIEVREGSVWLNLDLVGRSLHQRGYRRARGEAPLRENVAAQLLMLSRWDPRREALVDPMAGSGTIAIEGVAMAQGRALWCDSFTPLCMSLPNFAPLRDRKTSPLFADARPPIVANEINSDTLYALSANAERAGVKDQIQVFHGDFRDLHPDRVMQAVAGAECGLILVNPPYGQRAESKGAGDPEVAELYEDLRDWWRDLGLGWRLGILSDHPAVTSIFGRRCQFEKPVSNGQLKAWFRVYD